MMTKEANMGKFTTLQEIVTQLEFCGYECKAGRLEMNEAFIALKAMAMKDTNMDKQKPRICDVLGVEVGEKFSVDGFPDTKTMWVCAAGTYFTEPKHAKNSGYAMMYAIQHPESIIRQPRFTEEEVEDARTIARMFPDVCIFSRGAKGHLIVGNAAREVRFVLRPEATVFPSIRPGQSAKLSEITGEGRQST